MELTRVDYYKHVKESSKVLATQAQANHCPPQWTDPAWAAFKEFGRADKICP